LVQNFPPLSPLQFACRFLHFVDFNTGDVAVA